MKRLMGSLLFVWLVIAGAADAGRPAPQELVDRVLALVGDQVITLSDVRAVMAFGLTKPTPGAEPTEAALTYLVNRQLMLDEVDRYAAPEADPVMLSARLDGLRQQFASPAAFDAALTRTSWTSGRLREFLGDSIRIEAYLDQRFAGQAQPTPEEVLRYYEEHPADFTRAGRVLPFEAVQVQATERVTAERRAAAVAAWLDRLRRRVNVSNVYR